MTNNIIKVLTIFFITSPVILFANQCIIGDVQAFPFNYNIRNFHIADGSTISNSSSPELAEVLNNRFGSNDNSSNLPSISPIMTEDNKEISYYICTSGISPQRKIENQDNKNIEQIGADFGKIIPLSENYIPANFLPATGSRYPTSKFPELTKYIHYNFCFYKTEFCVPKIKSLETVDGQQKLEYGLYASEKPRVNECIIGEIALFPFKPNNVPSNFPYLPADGQKIKLTDNTMVLYAVIGQFFGYDEQSESYFLPNIKPIKENVNYYICAEGQFPMRN